MDVVGVVYVAVSKALVVHSIALGSKGKIPHFLKPAQIFEGLIVSIQASLKGPRTDI